MASNGKLNTRQRQAIAALLTSPNAKEAAALANVGERTLYRWLAENEAFKAALRQAQDEAIAVAVARLAGELPAAVDTIVQLRDGPDVPYSVQLQAAKALLAESRLTREFGELIERLDELETRFPNG